MTNHELEALPKIIKIMPNICDDYASDEDSCLIWLIDDCFSDHPRFSELVELHNHFLGLANWVEMYIDEKWRDSFYQFKRGGFPWQNLNKEALDLTQKLANILKNSNIKIIYCSRIEIDGEYIVEEIMFNER